MAELVEGPPAAAFPEGCACSFVGEAPSGQYDFTNPTPPPHGQLRPLRTPPETVTFCPFTTVTPTSKLGGGHVRRVGATGPHTTKRTPAPPPAGCSTSPAHDRPTTPRTQPPPGRHPPPRREGRGPDGKYDKSPAARSRPAKNASTACGNRRHMTHRMDPVTPDPDPQVGRNQQHGTVNAQPQPQEMGEPPTLQRSGGSHGCWDAKNTRNPTADTQPCPNDREPTARTCGIAHIRPIPPTTRQVRDVVGFGVG